MSDTNNAPFVFVSYAHKDSALVLPCIEALRKKNINVWFDDGIEAGSEWPEFIAEKVFGCTKFITFISRAYLESQNCKRELNFAISKKKDLLSVFIEDVELSLGVEMQLGTYQSIFKSRFPSEAAFLDSLGNEPWFEPCKTRPSAIATDDDKLALTIDKLDLSVRSFNCLKRGNIETVGDLVKRSVEDLMKIPNMGSQNLDEIVKKLDSMDLSLHPCRGSAAANTQPDTTVTPPQPVEPPAVPSGAPSKSRIIAFLLSIFMGFFGVHKFYLGQRKKGFQFLLFYLVCLIASFVLLGGSVALVVIPIAMAWYEGIHILRASEEALYQKYGIRFTR